MFGRLAFGAASDLVDDDAHAVLGDLAQRLPDGGQRGGLGVVAVVEADDGKIGAHGQAVR